MHTIFAFVFFLLFSFFRSMFSFINKIKGHPTTHQAIDFSQSLKPRSSWFRQICVCRLCTALFTNDLPHLRHPTPSCPHKDLLRSCCSSSIPPPPNTKFRPVGRSQFHSKVITFLGLDEEWHARGARKDVVVGGDDGGKGGNGGQWS